MFEPCMCGALDCPSCGRAQGTYDSHTTSCGNCEELMADCSCDNSHAREDEPDDDYDYDQAHEDEGADRAASEYEDRMERGQ